MKIVSKSSKSSIKSSLKQEKYGIPRTTDRKTVRKKRKIKEQKEENTEKREENRGKEVYIAGDYRKERENGIQKASEPIKSAQKLSKMSKNHEKS